MPKRGENIYKRKHLLESGPVESGSAGAVVDVGVVHLDVGISFQKLGDNACYECFYPLGSYHLLRRKSDFAKLTQKKNAATSKKITTLSKSCSVLSRTFLFALFFDFGNLLCRCGYNPYACIAHTVKKRVKLPPLRVLLRRRF